MLTKPLAKKDSEAGIIKDTATTGASTSGMGTAAAEGDAPLTLEEQRGRNLMRDLNAVTAMQTAPEQGRKSGNAGDAGSEIG